MAGDYTRQRPNGYALVPAGVAPPLRAANRQYQARADYFGNAPHSFNAFDGLTDADSYRQSNQDIGGVSLTATWEIGRGTLTSITAWRLWNWGPSSDQDFLGLPITTAFRYDFSSSPTESRYLTVDAYTTLAGRIGSRCAGGWGVYLWGPNLLDEACSELLVAQPGNSGLYVGQPSDPRTYGNTLRARF